jgi:hypothetical protein
MGTKKCMWCLTEFKTESKEKYCSCNCEKKNKNSSSKDYPEKGVAAILCDLTVVLFSF